MKTFEIGDRVMVADGCRGFAGNGRYKAGDIGTISRQSDYARDNDTIGPDGGGAYVMFPQGMAYLFGHEMTDPGPEQPDEPACDSIYENIAAITVAYGIVVEYDTTSGIVTFYPNEEK